MRPTQLAAALAALLLAIPLVAAETRTFGDEAGDESVSPTGRTEILVAGFDAGECRAAAADIRALSFATTADDIVLSLTMASLADLRAQCPFVGIHGSQADYSVAWRTVLEDTDLLGFPSGLRASAGTTGFGISSCIRLSYDDANGAQGQCLGSAQLQADTIVWTLPITGTDLVEVCDEPTFCLLFHDEERPYDFRGFTGELGGRATVSFNTEISGIPFTAITDDVDGALVSA